MRELTRFTADVTLPTPVAPDLQAKWRRERSVRPSLSLTLAPRRRTWSDGEGGGKVSGTRLQTVGGKRREGRREEEKEGGRRRRRRREEEEEGGGGGGRRRRRGEEGGSTHLSCEGGHVPLSLGHPLSHHCKQLRDAGTGTGEWENGTLGNGKTNEMWPASTCTCMCV